MLPATGAVLSLSVLIAVVISVSEEFLQEIGSFYTVQRLVG